jgi:hypothetical protein
MLNVNRCLHIALLKDVAPVCHSDRSGGISNYQIKRCLDFARHDMRSWVFNIVKCTSSQIHSPLDTPALQRV